MRVNTIFEVVKAAGGRTAWVDKHPSYEWTNGPSGKGVDDFYGPEINSIPVALPQSAGCSPVPFADPTPDDGWTTSFGNVQCYDSIHVQAVINQIDGYNHDRSQHVGVPALFGTNFQSVSVGEKFSVDPVSGLKGGYTDAIGTPGQGLLGQIDFVDRSLNRIEHELNCRGSAWLTRHSSSSAQNRDSHPSTLASGTPSAGASPRPPLAPQTRSIFR